MFGVSAPNEILVLRLHSLLIWIPLRKEDFGRIIVIGSLRWIVTILLKWRECGLLISILGKQQHFREVLFHVFKSKNIHLIKIKF